MADRFVSLGRSPANDGDYVWDLDVLEDPQDSASAYLIFERRDPETYRALKVTDGVIFLLGVEHGVESFLCAGIPFDPVPGAHYVVAVRRRASTLSVLAGGARLLSLTDPPPQQPGAFGYRIEPETTAPWLRVAAARWVQSPTIRFDRSFAAQELQGGNWDVVCGSWFLRPLSHSPQAALPLAHYRGQDGLVLAGGMGWDNYVARVALRLGGPNTSAGLAFYALSPHRYYLLRLAAMAGVQRLELVKVEEGVELVLESRPTRLAPGQWCDLKVAVADDAVKTYLDGEYAFIVHDDGLVGGRVGFWVQGRDPAQFDGLMVRSLRISRADFLEDRAGRAIPPTHAVEEPPDAWRQEETADGILWEHTSDFYGNVSLTWEPAGTLPAGGMATLILCAEESDPKSGYAFTLMPEGDDRIGVRLARANRELRSVHLELPKPNHSNPPNDSPLKAVLSKTGSVICALLNEEPVIEFSDPAPLTGARVRFLTDLSQPQAARNLRVRNENARTELFESAPVNWAASSGEWDILPQVNKGGPCLVCQPSGFGPSVVWHKNAFAGDLTLEYDVSLWEMPSSVSKAQETPTKGLFPPNFNAVFCADGRDLASGYCLMFSPPTSVGAPAWPIRLLRQGRIVAESRRLLFSGLSPSSDDQEAFNPRDGWWRLRLQRREGYIRFFVNDRLALEYCERFPLEGTRLGLWTLGTPMAISRVRVAWSKDVSMPSVFAPDVVATDALPLSLPKIGIDPRLVALCEYASAREKGNVSIALDGDAVKVTNQRGGGEFALPLITSPMALAPGKPCVLSFDFKSSPHVAINLYAKVDDQTYAIPLTGPAEHAQNVGVLPRLHLSGSPMTWRSVCVNLGNLSPLGSAPKTLVALWLGNASVDWRAAAGLGSNRIGSSYWVRRIRFSSP